MERSGGVLDLEAYRRRAESLHPRPGSSWGRYLETVPPEEGAQVGAPRRRRAIAIGHVRHDQTSGFWEKTATRIAAT